MIDQRLVFLEKKLFWNSEDENNLKKKNFKFDKVFDTESDQMNVFDGLKIPQLITRVVDGYHATIFAYGQTGSGKTYTMEGYDYKK